MAHNYFPEEVIEEVFVPDQRVRISKLDHIGKTYGKWTVLKHLRSSDYKVRCACGYEGKRRIQALYQHKSTQCSMCAHRNKPFVRQRL